MSILRPNAGYEIFEEVNVGRRKFIVHEDHNSEVPFNKKLLIGFGAILLVASLLFVIMLYLSNSYVKDVEELPYIHELVNGIGKDSNTVAKSLSAAGVQLTFGSELGEYRFANPVRFMGEVFDVTLSFNENKILESITYDLQLPDDAEGRSTSAYVLLWQTQEIWGFSKGNIFTSAYVEYDVMEIYDGYAGSEQWEEELSWVISRGISHLGFDETAGDCISIRLFASSPAEKDQARTGFTVGLDFAKNCDFAYKPGKITGIHK